MPSIRGVVFALCTCALLALAKTETSGPSKEAGKLPSVAFDYTGHHIVRITFEQNEQIDRMHAVINGAYDAGRVLQDAAAVQKASHLEFMSPCSTQGNPCTVRAGPSLAPALIAFLQDGNIGAYSAYYYNSTYIFTYHPLCHFCV